MKELYLTAWLRNWLPWKQGNALLFSFLLWLCSTEHSHRVYSTHTSYSRCFGFESLAEVYFFRQSLHLNVGILPRIWDFYSIHKTSIRIIKNESITINHGLRKLSVHCLWNSQWHIHVLFHAPYFTALCNWLFSAHPSVLNYLHCWTH
jgi:hypothetical protein